VWLGPVPVPVAAGPVPAGDTFTPFLSSRQNNASNLMFHLSSCQKQQHTQQQQQQHQHQHDIKKRK
jgi:hypothetical protein